MIIQVYDDDLLNGEGIREVVFLQGCPHHCSGCFSPETWEFKEETEESKARTFNFIQRLTKKLAQPYISGITITGGDPLIFRNLSETEHLVDIAKLYNKNVWVYTGHTWEYVENNIPLHILKKIDVLCDGPFIESLKSPEKPWVGSSNQRVINVQESLRQRKIIEL